MQTSLFSVSIEDELAALRKQLAQAQGVAESKIWPDKVTAALVLAAPKSFAELYTVSGLSKKKADLFGVDILKAFGVTASKPKAAKPTAKKTELPDTPPLGKLEKILGVSDYLDYINQILKITSDVKVLGEISKFTNHPTGVYLSLKDKEGDGVLDCYINPYTYRGLGMQLEEGMEIKVSGVPGIFKRRSQLSLRVESLELAGEGTLKKSYELLKRKLENEGIFDRKRELPEFIHSVGIITSKTGAVIDDFRKNLEHLGFDLKMKDCRVEGAQSAKQVMAAIEYFNIKHPNLDCLVVMRGGGSLEDMQAFNDEAVVKAVFASRIPTIAALGHDRDVPLVCLAADRFTSTPTAAAMLINASWQRLKTQLPQLSQTLVHAFSSDLNATQSKLQSLVQQLTANYNAVFQRIHYLEEKVLRGLERIAQRITQIKQTAQTIITTGVQIVEQQLAHTTETTTHIEKLLAAANPERNLQLGYSLAYDTNGELVRSTKQLKTGDRLNLSLSDGTINTEVKD